MQIQLHVEQLRRLKTYAENPDEHELSEGFPKMKEYDLKRYIVMLQAQVWYLTPIGCTLICLHDLSIVVMGKEIK